MKLLCVLLILFLTTPLYAKEEWKKEGSKWVISDTVVIKTVDRVILDEAVAYRQRQIDNLREEIIKLEAEKKTFEDDLVKLNELGE